VYRHLVCRRLQSRYGDADNADGIVGTLRLPHACHGMDLESVFGVLGVRERSLGNNARKGVAYFVVCFRGGAGAGARNDNCPLYTFFFVVVPSFH
jgi:hypothetical protein